MCWTIRDPLFSYIYSIYIFFFFGGGDKLSDQSDGQLFFKRPMIDQLRNIFEVLKNYVK
jgi:hypothetical protein